MKKGDRGKTAKNSGAPEDEFLEDEEEGNEQAYDQYVLIGTFEPQIDFYQDTQKEIEQIELIILSLIT